MPERASGAAAADKSKDLTLPESQQVDMGGCGSKEQKPQRPDSTAEGADNQKGYQETKERTNTLPDDYLLERAKETPGYLMARSRIVRESMPPLPRHYDTAQSLKEDTQLLRKKYMADQRRHSWLVLKYNEEGDIVLAAKGTEWQEFRAQFDDGERAYGFLRQITGDELSKRTKFAFIAWIGRDVSPLKRAKTGTEKALVKEVLKSFAVECTFGGEDAENFNEDYIRGLLVKAGGANYGTGER